MSDEVVPKWAPVLRAVVTLAVARPARRDGEVGCANTRCRDPRTGEPTALCREDLVCWRCGCETLVPLSEEMRLLRRVPPPPPEPEPVATATAGALAQAHAQAQASMCQACGRPSAPRAGEVCLMGRHLPVAVMSGSCGACGAAISAGEVCDSGRHVGVGGPVSVPYATMSVPVSVAAPGASAWHLAVRARVVDTIMRFAPSMAAADRHFVQKITEAAARVFDEVWLATKHHGDANAALHEVEHRIQQELAGGNVQRYLSNQKYPSPIMDRIHKAWQP